MQIFAPSGSGKSGLLRLFRDYCGNEVDARSVLIDLRIDDDQAPLTVLDIATAIRDAIAFDREFGEFERLTEAMEIEDHAVFFAEAATRSTVVNANVYIKQVQNSPITAMNVHTGAGRDGPFTSAQKDVATRRCVEAFGSELRALVATTPVLIAIDHWERGPRELLDWIQRDLVRAEMAASESSRLRLVVAGQPRSAEWPLGVGGSAVPSGVRLSRSVRRSRQPASEAVGVQGGGAHRRSSNCMAWSEPIPDSTMRSA